jgi:type II secretory pathway component PulJ
VTEDSYYAPRTGAGSHIGGPSTGSDGFDRPVSAAQHQRALTLAADLAGLWQTTKETSDVPSETDFDISGQTQNRLGSLAAYPQDGVQANGLLGHYTFYALPTDRLVEVGVAGGDDLACQPLRESVDYRPQEGQLIRQDPARHNWGPAVAPGYYHEVLSKDVWQTCFLVPPDGGAVVVLNQDVGGAVVHVAT